ncbi:unnamed protein product [Peronospora farinosa]|uniref:Uncharacterized protein n=1 Tax=Peronospora farinosa TaxID=134698 RepID=A0AAV0TCN6_9STRA|nr:unnamed protein product [Peronospora farinosa]
MDSNQKAEERPSCHVRAKSVVVECVVAAVKRRYRYQLLDYALDRREEGQLDIYDIPLQKVVEWMELQLPRTTVLMINLMRRFKCC